MRALAKRLKKLEATCMPKARGPVSIFLDIPGGKPARAYFHDGGPPFDWPGGDDYPPITKLYQGIDPDALFGTSAGLGSLQTTS
jgi:hypothetical protein